MSSTKHH